MKKLTFVIIFGLLSAGAYAQKQDVTELFQDEKPLDIKLRFSIKDIKKKTNDSTYLPAMFYLKNSAGAWDSIKTDVRARGIFRRKTCYFPPIRIKVDKSERKGTSLKGNKSLKLVMPCLNNEGKNPLVLKEYMCYQMFEQVTPYYFNTRLVNLDFTDADGKKSKNYKLTGFLIEDDDLVAKRHGAKVMENLNLHPMGLNDTSSLRHDLFQFMIANTDWSTTFLHNAKVMFKEPRKYIPLAYDFDMSGFVDPPYAEVNPDLGITSVRDRLYRGFCRKDPVTQLVRKDFIDAEPRILAVVDNFSGDFEPKEIAEMKKYLGEFFKVLKDDKLFKNNITDKCRTKN